MARAIHLNANTPGGNSFAKSQAAQKRKDGTKTPTPVVKVPKRNPARRSGTKSASMSMAEAGFVPPIMGGNSMDYASSWFQSKGLKNAQNDGSVPRLPYATVPADRLTAGNNSTRAKSQVASSKTAKKRPGTRSGTSNATVTKRVNTKYTGKSFKNSTAKRSVSKRPVVFGA